MYNGLKIIHKQHLASRKPSSVLCLSEGLVDDICPKYSRFVKGLNSPNHSSTKTTLSGKKVPGKTLNITFGVIQSHFKVMEHAILCCSLRRSEQLYNAFSSYIIWVSPIELWEEMYMLDMIHLQA